jgi:uncharacterized membrane protein YkvA (DUF1232 family)
MRKKTWVGKARSAVSKIRHEVGFYRALLTDPRVPRLAKAVLAFALLYLASPIDLIPDFIPVIGHLDDLVIVPFLFWLALRLIPRDILQEHRDATLKRG